MDKVIIGGVDVSECAYHRMNNEMAMCTACNSGVGSPYCEYHKDCYYKQLQRLEQENAELKAECEKLKSWLDKAEQEQKKFIDKNRELKQQVKTLNYMLFEEKEMSKNEYTLKYKLADKERRWTQYKHLTKGKLDNYRQTLQEIRDMIAKPYCCKPQDILDKINEVIGVEE